MIVLENINKNYGKNHILKDINLQIKESESVAFLGANGSGKTTLVEIISGVLKPSTGKVKFVNNKQEKVKKTIGVQFQDGYWPSGTTPIDLIKFYKGRGYLKTLEGQKLIDVFELKYLLKKEISALSGGQRQRFNCFLSILNDPDILVLDELVTGLDLKMQIKLVNFLKEWKTERKVNLLIVSHTPEEVELLCDRVLLLKDGEIYSDQLITEIIKNNGSLRKMLINYF
ncbi:ATP-binding cassette domain-containing protein [Spiroplasma endosymbiont of Stenodema calcarata]|uniref:ATP-binding cassette domain-containing protein n=1 Tax=Spiroplasma endosymbiont of Stenodema calcarata TaxID=3139328 RepID=UPI003CCAB29B